MTLRCDCDLFDFVLLIKIDARQICVTVNSFAFI